MREERVECVHRQRTTRSESSSKNCHRLQLEQTVSGRRKQQNVTASTDLQLTKDTSREWPKRLRIADATTSHRSEFARRSCGLSKLRSADRKRARWQEVGTFCRQAAHTATRVATPA